MIKEPYEFPVMEIIQFETEDIITASSDIDQGDIDPITGIVQ